MPDLKERIFGETGEIISQEDSTLEEILEFLSREEKKVKAFVLPLNDSKIRDASEFPNSFILVDEEDKKEKPNIFLYEFFENTYYVYLRREREEKSRENGYSPAGGQKKEEHSYGLFMPTGVIVRRVPQNILGNGVLGRAFIHQNYIEILDSLVGNEYTEVLTHEVFHIMYPEKRELEIRNMTKIYVGEKSIYH